MPVTTICPTCSASFTVAEALVGRKARCKKCGEPFTIATMDRSPAGASVIDDHSHAPITQRLQQPSSKAIPTKPCPYCQEAIRTDATNCPFCGESVAAAGLLRGASVAGALAWLIVAIPVAGAIIELVTGSELPAKGYWFLNAGLCALDAKLLRDSGHEAPSAWWAALIPVYLYKRATLLAQKQIHFWAWVGSFAASVLVVVAVAISTERTDPVTEELLAYNNHHIMAWIRRHDELVRPLQAVVGANYKDDATIQAVLKAGLPKLRDLRDEMGQFVPKTKEVLDLHELAGK